MTQERRLKPADHDRRTTERESGPVPTSLWETFPQPQAWALRWNGEALKLIRSGQSVNSSSAAAPVTDATQNSPLE